MRAGLVIVLAGMVAAPLAAQTVREDVMEAQRCVWRCLADSTGTGDPTYHACVEAICNAPEPPVQVGAAWTMGTTADSLGIFAALADPATGNALYYICDGAGAGYLLLSGEVEGPSAILTVRVGSEYFPLPFEAQGAGYYAATPRGAAVVARMARGGMVQVLNGRGFVLGSYPLPVEGNAVAQIDAQCRG